MSLIDYLKAPGVDEYLDLVKSGEIKLHWSNWDTLIAKIKDDFESDSDSHSLSSINEKLEEFKNTPVWIFNKKAQMETNLFEIYNFYLDPRMRELWFELNDDTLISLKSVHGPFLRLQSLRWLKMEDYKFFIYDRLVSNKSIKSRSFRMNVDIPLNVELVDSVIDDLSLVIKQVSRDGFLVEVSDHASLQKLKEAGQAQLSVNLTPFKKAQKASISEMDKIFSSNVFDSKIKALSIFNVADNLLKLGNNSTNMNFSNGEKTYLFLNFNHLQDSKDKSVKKSICKVIDTFESHLLDTLEAA